MYSLDYVYTYNVNTIFIYISSMELLNQTNNSILNELSLYLGFTVIVIFSQVN